MGGGDLNMKKSWHPLLLKNQERVWLEEKKALEEKKKLDQLRKEKEEERQLQELQRLQEEQTGKKRTEKLEWMYTTPATGSNQNANDLEDYLLGKKRVDKILTADENAKLGASHKSFIAVQNANTARDVASKIREDPLLAMKQQEQAAYQALMSNPLRLRELQERNGIKPKKNKEKEKRREKKGKEKSKDTEHRTRGRTPSRSLSPIDDHRRRRSRSYERYDRDYPRRSPSPRTRRSRSPIRSHRDSHRSEYRSRRSRSRSPESHHRHRDDRIRIWPRSDESDDNRRNYSRDGGRRYTDDLRKRRRSPSPVNSGAKRSRITPPPHSRSLPADSASKTTNDAEDRAARLAAMQSNASNVEVDRQKRLLELLAKERAKMEAENEARSRSKGMGSFLGQEQKKVFGGEGGLEDRIRRGRGGLVVDAD
ncbi:Pre-mRNA splicing factor-domain-containing protein [Boletus edulis]|uniref:Pre-mRNA splicing factor-domain-containing protein n=1 Tax=Boletus edulis BED1 TaxID=1328754 RepID=A0AAD4C1Z5_BOLED|nr:Pre-mRNA splicing factor-domain-containing protein [Boletus edulis]KAF8445565.1 Pre-mRNA splicing factor-domain-containing protein [Boletus edulis BED1]